MQIIGKSFFKFLLSKWFSKESDPLLLAFVEDSVTSCCCGCKQLSLYFKVGLQLLGEIFNEATKYQSWVIEIDKQELIVILRFDLIYSDFFIKNQVEYQVQLGEKGNKVWAID